MNGIRHLINWRVVGVGTAALWVITVMIMLTWFIQGHTRPASDGRTEILLAPAERDLVLAEMRDLLKAVHGVVTVLGRPSPNLKGCGRGSSRGRHGDGRGRQPAIMLKLPSHSSKWACPFIKIWIIWPMVSRKARRRSRFSVACRV